jgi:hypothetical protein
MFALPRLTDVESLDTTKWLSVFNSNFLRMKEWHRFGAVIYFFVLNIRHSNRGEITGALGNVLGGFIRGPWCGIIQFPVRRTVRAVLKGRGRVP